MVGRRRRCTGREAARYLSRRSREEEVGVAVISRDPALRLEGALAAFPLLAEKLRGRSLHNEGIW